MDAENANLFQFFKIICGRLSFYKPCIHQELCLGIGLVEKKFNEVLGIDPGRKIFFGEFKCFDQKGSDSECFVLCKEG